MTPQAPTPPFMSVGVRWAALAFAGWQSTIRATYSFAGERSQPLPWHRTCTARVLCLDSRHVRNCAVDPLGLRRLRRRSPHTTEKSSALCGHLMTLAVAMALALAVALAQR
jgi:hypothetical protein